MSTRDQDICVITCAVTGVLANRKQCAGIPYTPVEIAEETKRAYDAGASVLREAAVALAALDPTASDSELVDEVADLRRVEASFLREDVSVADAKYLGQMAYATHRGKRRGKEALRRGDGE